MRRKAELKKRKAKESGEGEEPAVNEPAKTKGKATKKRKKEWWEKEEGRRQTAEDDDAECYREEARSSQSNSCIATAWLGSHQFCIRDHDRACCSD